MSSESVNSVNSRTSNRNRHPRQLYSPEPDNPRRQRTPPAVRRQRERVDAERHADAYGSPQHSPRREPRDRRQAAIILNADQYVVGIQEHYVVTVCHARDVRGDLFGGAVVEATPHNYIIRIQTFFPTYDEAIQFGRQFSALKGLILVFVDENNAVQTIIPENANMDHRIMQIVNDHMTALSAGIRTETADALQRLTAVFH